MNTNTLALSRRQALGLGAGLVAGSVLAGCSSRTVTKIKPKKLTVPAYVPVPHVAGGMTSSNPLVPPIFTDYPEHPFTSVTKTPANGGKITVHQLVWTAPPTELSNNKWWQALNTRLGCEWSPTYVPAANYDTKMSTMLASGKIPDVVWMNVSLPTFQAMQEGAFVDLSKILAGDGIKPYPNLAHITTHDWKNSSINGSIFGIPLASPVINQAHVYRADWAEKLGYPEQPKSAEELLELLTAFSKGKPFGNTKTWGIAQYYFGSALAADVHSVPTGYRLTSGGKFVPALDTDEYESALHYLREMWLAGVFHPDALVYDTDYQKAEALWTAGRAGYYSDGISGFINTQPGRYGYIDASVKGARTNYLITPGVGGKPAVNVADSGGTSGITAISAAAAKDPKRLKEILRVLDYWAAPFGSKEYLFLHFGIEGRHWSRDAKGQIQSTTDQKLTAEMTGNYLCTPASTVFVGNTHKAEAKRAFTYEEGMAKHISSDPSAGLFSETGIKKTPTLGQLSATYESDIVTGRKPLSDLKEWRQRWHSEGGDKILSELEEALQVSQNKHKAKPTSSGH